MENVVEIWKPIVGYEEFYEVSSLGRVKGLDRRVKNKNGERFAKGVIKQTKLNNNGYEIISLFKNGKEKTYLIHRLVAQAFIPNPNNFPEINHRDEIKTNNRLDNLEWCDRKYNRHYGTRIERCAKKHCKPIVQLSKKGDLICVFESAAKAGEKLNIDRRSLSKCCNKQKTAYGFKWQFVGDWLADWWDKEMDKFMEKEKAA